MESINNTASTNKEKFHFIKQQSVYHGKVRDVYNIDDKYLVMVVSDRISAFDVILPRPIPYKGQVLNQVAAYFLEATKDIVPNWVIAVPAANVTVGLKCNPIKIEMVVRGYLAGHAARTYASGKRTLCGVALPEGMKENDKFPHPIITPTTKAAAGHDEDISRDDIIDRKLVGRKDYEMLEQYTLQLYLRGAEMAAKKGLILVDTKYEFGKIGDTIYLMDEIHTPDSSRYCYAEGYEERQLKREAQKQLSKEFLRQWLINNGFQGLEGQQVPLMTDEIVNEVSLRYIELFEKVTGQKFIPSDYTNHPDRTEISVNELINKLIP